MDKVSFKIPYPTTKAEKKHWSKEFGLNAIYAGKHWAKRKEDGKYWHWLVKSELIKQKIPRELFTAPVEILFSYNDGFDCSNHAYMAKMIEDSLKGWLLTDDSRKYVKRITHEFHDGDSIIVEIKEA